MSDGSNQQNDRMDYIFVCLQEPGIPNVLINLVILYSYEFEGICDLYLQCHKSTINCLATFPDGRIITGLSQDLMTTQLEFGIFAVIVKKCWL